MMRTHPLNPGLVVHTHFSLQSNTNYGFWQPSQALGERCCLPYPPECPIWKLKLKFLAMSVNSNCPGRPLSHTNVQFGRLKSKLPASLICWLMLMILTSPTTKDNSRSSSKETLPSRDLTESIVHTVYIQRFSGIRREKELKALCILAPLKLE